jgi:hypothetical protein
MLGLTLTKVELGLHMRIDSSHASYSIHVRKAAQDGNENCRRSYVVETPGGKLNFGEAALDAL